jgi:hypothetical protein
LRKRRPPANVSCGRCSRRTYDPRYKLRIFEIVETRELEEQVRAAQERPRHFWEKWRP